MRKPTRAAIYARLSQDRSGESLSIPAQIALARARADERGWTVVEEYVDSNISASTGARRPQWERLLADIAAGTIDGVVSKGQDRLSRQWSGLGRLLDLCDKHNVSILTLDDEIDPRTADGRLKVSILAAVAENEARKLSERVKQQRERAALIGAYVGGRRSFGYAGKEDHERDPKMIPGITIIPPEATHVAKLEHRAVIERPRGAYVRVRWRIFVRDPQRARHSEVHDELAIAVEPRDQVLAPAADRFEPVRDRIHRGREFRRRVRVRVDDRSADDPGRELPADRLHLGQLGHA